jgi:hypothetical protein
LGLPIDGELNGGVVNCGGKRSATTLSRAHRVRIGGAFLTSEGAVAAALGQCSP